MISDDKYYEGVVAAKSLPDKREVHLRRMLFNLRLAVTDRPMGLCYEEEYCYHVLEFAWAAFEIWDGESPPPMFAKNATTGERGPGFVDDHEARASHRRRMPPLQEIPK